MEAFNPAQAIQTLRENYLAIEALGLEIEQKANEHTIAEAETEMRNLSYNSNNN